MSSSPVITEVVTFKALDTLDATRSLLADSAAKLAGSEDVLQHWTGSRVEEPHKWQLFVDRKFLENREAASVLEAKSAKLLPTISMATHVQFAPYDEYVKSLEAPVTEIIYATLKDTADAKVFKEINDASLVASVDDGGCLSWAWGHGIENERVIVIVIGWDSIETHKTFLQTESFKRTTDPWAELVSYAGAVYVNFTRK